MDGISLTILGFLISILSLLIYNSVKTSILEYRVRQLYRRLRYLYRELRSLKRKLRRLGQGIFY